MTVCTVCPPGHWGGGAVPGIQLDSYAVALPGDINPEEYEQLLRGQLTPIIGRIDGNKMLLDVRTMFEDDFDYIASVIGFISA